MILSAGVWLFYNEQADERAGREAQQALTQLVAEINGAGTDGQTGETVATVTPADRQCRCGPGCRASGCGRSDGGGNRRCGGGCRHAGDRRRNGRGSFPGRRNAGAHHRRAYVHRVRHRAGNRAGAAHTAGLRLRSAGHFARSLQGQPEGRRPDHRRA